MTVPPNDQNQTNDTRSKQYGSKKKHLGIAAIALVLVAAIVGSIILRDQLFPRSSDQDVIYGAALTETTDRQTESDTVLISQSEATTVTTTAPTETTAPLVETQIQENVTVEVGVADLTPDAFIIQMDPSLIYGFTGTVDHVDLSVPDDYPLQLLVGTEVFEVVLTVTDSVAPVIEVQDLTVPIGRELAPEDFITKAEDSTALTYRFLTSLNPNSSETQSVTIEAEDLGGNKTQAKATVRFIDLKERVVVEAGRQEPLRTAEFISDSAPNASVVAISDLSAYTFRHVGVFHLEFQVDGEPATSILQVVDTVAPQGSGREAEAFYNTQPDPANFVTNITDETDVNVSWSKKPDMTRFGRQEVKVLLTDEGGNTTVVTSYLNVLNDEVAPQLYGVKDYTYIPGEGRGFMDGVYATDDRDSNPKVTYDASQVNEKVAGTYQVTYTAKDAAGNTVTKTADVTVKLRTPYSPGGSTGNARLNTLADGVLSQITNGDMTDYEKAYAIYRWLGRSLSYRAQTNRTDLVAGAITGLTKRNGDCYIYRFTNQALLNRSGISNYGMNSDSGSHSWTMVQLGRTVVSDPLWGYFDVNLSVVQSRANGMVHWDDEHAETNRLDNVEKEIPFESIEKENPELLEGVRVLIQDGVKGLENYTYSITLRDNVETSRTLLEQTVITEPINEIYEVGTRVNILPVISGVQNYTIKIGESVDLANGVTATDDRDGALEVVINQEGFDNQVPGTYTIAYSATDKDGGVATVNGTVTVLAPETTPTTTAPTTTTTTTAPTTTTSTTIPTSTTTTAAPTTTTTAAPTTTTTTAPPTSTTTAAPTTTTTTTAPTTEPTTVPTTAAPTTAATTQNTTTTASGTTVAP